MTPSTNALVASTYLQTLRIHLKKLIFTFALGLEVDLLRSHSTYGMIVSHDAWMYEI